MILDVFTYCGEQRFLESRVKTLAELNVEHLALLADRSHQGDRWPDATLAEWSEDCRLLGVPAFLVGLGHLDGQPRGGAGNPGYQVRERWHRNGGSYAASGTVDDHDLVALSDVDEIPRAEMLGAITVDDVPEGRVVTLAMRMHTWGATWLYPGPWLGTTVARRSTVRNYGLQWMRDARGTDRSRTIAEDTLSGGWHLSWWGDDTTRRTKLWTFSHYELVSKQDDLARLARVGTDINGVDLVGIDPADYDWPEGIAP